MKEGEDEEEESPHNHPFYHDPNAFSPRSEHQLPHTFYSQRAPPTALELGPSDSLSQMYRPFRGPPPESVRSTHTRARSHSRSRQRLPLQTAAMQQDGTNVDPADYEEEYVEDELENRHEQHSAWETRGRAISDAGAMEAMTPGRTEWYPETTVYVSVLFHS